MISQCFSLKNQVDFYLNGTFKHISHVIFTHFKIFMSITPLDVQGRMKSGDSCHMTYSLVQLRHKNYMVRFKKSHDLLE